MDKEEIVRRFRSWLYRTHGYGGRITEKQLEATLGSHLFQQIFNDA